MFLGKVRTLLNYSNVVYLHFFPRGPRITESTNYRIFFVYISDFLRSCETNQPKNARKSTDKEETPLHCSVICNLWRFLHNPPKQKTKFTSAGISEFCAKIMIQFANEIKFLVENGKILHFTVVHRGIKSPRSNCQKHVFSNSKKLPFFCIEGNFLMITPIFKYFSWKKNYSFLKNSWIFDTN